MQGARLAILAVGFSIRDLPQKNVRYDEHYLGYVVCGHPLIRLISGSVNGRRSDSLVDDDHNQGHESR